MLDSESQATSCSTRRVKLHHARLGESSYIMLDSESHATPCSIRRVELHADAVGRIPVAASGVVELELAASEGFVET